MTNICENIKTLRILRNITQESVAESLGLSQSAYGKLERGETNLTWNKLLQILDVLEVTLWDLLNMKGGNIPKRVNPKSTQPTEIHFPDIDQANSAQKIAFLKAQLANKKTIIELLESQLKDKMEIIELLQNKK